MASPQTVQDQEQDQEDENVLAIAARDLHAEPSPRAAEGRVVIPLHGSAEGDHRGLRVLAVEGWA